MTQHSSPVKLLGSRKLVAFVATNDADRARAFYQDVLGLRLVGEELPFALVFDANGTMLRVTIVPDFLPAKHTVLGWDVADIAATAAHLQRERIACERYGFLEQDALGIWQSPSGAKVAWFKDPDGNTLSMTEF